MPQLFLYDTTTGDAGSQDSWAVLALEHTGVRLSPGPRTQFGSFDIGDSETVSAAGVYVVRDRDDWVLLAGPAGCVDVNGVPVTAGIRVLADRDEIRVEGDSPCFFSTEELPSVQPYAGPESACMRCRLLLEPDSPTVSCPVCRIAHHEDVEGGRACWTGFDGCASCRHPTAMDAGFRFSPGDL